jgi:antitoxin CcdA
MSLVYDVTAPKKATNISINSDLIQKAKAYKINLSKTLEQELDKLIRKKAEKEWLEENKEAIEVYNKRIENKGTIAMRMMRAKK